MLALLRRGMPVSWTRACGILQQLHTESSSLSQYVLNKQTSRMYHQVTPLTGDYLYTLAATRHCVIGARSLHDRQRSADLPRPTVESTETVDADDTIKNIYFDLQQNFVQKHVMVILKKVNDKNTFSSPIEMASLADKIRKLDDLFSTANDEQKENFAKSDITQSALSTIVSNVCAHIKKLPESALVQLLGPLDNFQEISRTLAAAVRPELQCRISTASLTDVFSLLNVLSGNPEDDLYQESIEVINKHIRETTFSKDMVSTLFLLYRHDYVGGVNVKRLESKILNEAQFLEPKQLYKILYLSAKMRKRSALVQTCAHYLLEKEWNFSETELCNLFFFCSSLRVNHIEFATKITNLLCGILEKSQLYYSRSLSLIKSCSFAHWNDQQLLSHLVRTVLEKKDEISAENLVLLAVSLGTLRFKEFDKEKVLAIAEGLDEMRSEKPQLWLKFVWSLCMMETATEDLVKSVIDDEFSMQMLHLMQAEDVHNQVATYNMMLNVWAHYVLQLGGTTNSTFTQIQEAAQDVQLVMRNVSSPSMLSSAVTLQVHDSLSKIAVLSMCVTKNIKNKFGYKADFELFVNANGQPVPFSEKAKNKRVLIKVVNFKDLLFSRHGAPEPSGQVAMAIRHLKTPHNAVIVISYKDWEQYVTEQEKLGYLQELLKKAAHGAEQ